MPANKRREAGLFKAMPASNSSWLLVREQPNLPSLYKGWAHQASADYPRELRRNFFIPRRLADIWVGFLPSLECLLWVDCLLHHNLAVAAAWKGKWATERENVDLENP